MGAAIKLFILVSLVSGAVLLFLSMYVLHDYEVKYNKRPPSFQWWPFISEMKTKYPAQSKVGRALLYTGTLCSLPCIISLIHSNG